MKKSITVIVLVTVLTFIGWFSYKIYTKARQKETSLQNAQHIPSFYFKSQRGQIFTRDSIKSQNVIINYFSPSCEHCQYMAQEFIKNKSLLLDKEILMVTIANQSDIDSFAHTYKLYTMPNITIVQDTAYAFNKIFGTSVIPSFFIYHDKELVKKIIGETKVENILNK